MTSLTITGLDETLAARLRESAVRHGRSAEDEARAILETALASTPEGLFGEWPAGTGADMWRDIRARIDAVGGVDLDLPPRGPAREPPDFGPGIPE